MTDTNSTVPPTPPADSPGFLCTLRMGFAVLGSEFKWLCLRLLRQVEIGQMEKRLRQEYLHLGRLMEEARAGSPEAARTQTESELTFRQIEFLKDEIAYLRNELQERRNEFVLRRRSALCQ